jgi:hypothetical protein
VPSEFYSGSLKGKDRLQDLGRHVGAPFTLQDDNITNVKLFIVMIYDE